MSAAAAGQFYRFLFQQKFVNNRSNAGHGKKKNKTFYAHAVFFYKAEKRIGVPIGWYEKKFKKTEGYPPKTCPKHFPAQIFPFQKYKKPKEQKNETAGDVRVFIRHLIFYGRRGRDSNPRRSCPLNNLAGCSFQPLRHLSSILIYIMPEIKFPVTLEK